MEKFKLVYEGKYSDVRTSIVVSFEACDGDTLLNHLRDFMQAVGYHSAVQLKAHDEDGDVWSMSDR